MSTTKDSLVNDFNNTLLDLINNIAYVCPDTIIGNNSNYIQSLLKNSENKTKFIEAFVARVLVYKPQIDAGDESFFLNKSYDEDIKDVNSSNMDLSSKVFEFKNIWKELNKENKDYIIQYMQLLCLLAQQYFMIVYG